MRARQLLPAALALTVLVVLSGCANGSGLRVEGAEPAATPARPSVSTNRGFGPAQTPTPTAAPTPAVKVAESKMTLPQVRSSLQADTALDPFFKTIVAKCTIVERCLTRGASVDVLKSGQPQLVVLIHTVESFVVGAVLMADSPKGPRRVWSLKAEQLKIIPSRQGDLVAESEIFNPEDAPCCPSGRLVEVYRWAGGQVTKVSTKEQKGD
ncbi:hypothetical protein [Streptomyces sp. SID13031]|uniref:hypothetical protein n=1 Tax=Streptomyces sp. SID13031 TaxID=2706046 RepID=UPI0013C583A1|nr:hypothetical protein [Streptomyces sp. SID13031]NEA31160.1 hypothetical protein [Streptomyces sp. SID13031]